MNQPPTPPRKGRGTSTFMAGRFDTHISHWEDDGWFHEPTNTTLKTHVSAELAKTILNVNQSPDLPFGASLNPYRGCEHGCVYCYARPSHSYLGLSPGLDFESRLFAKTNAAHLLRQALAHPKYTVDPIAIGVNTDAYQPCERQWTITRQVLEVLHECQHPFALITKSALIERDLDLLTPMAARQLCHITITLTTLDHPLARILEPRAAAPKRRLETIYRLSQAGIPVAVNLAPIIPFINDHEIETLLNACKNAGAEHASLIFIRLPWEVNTLFQTWLEQHFPDRAQRVMNRIRDLRGGKENDSRFHTRMQGQGPWAQLWQQRFNQCAKRLGLNKDKSFAHLNTALFRRPHSVPAELIPHGQGDLFG